MDYFNQVHRATRTPAVALPELPRYLGLAVSDFAQWTEEICAPANTATTSEQHYASASASANDTASAPSIFQASPRTPSSCFVISKHKKYDAPSFHVQVSGTIFGCD